MSFFNDILNIFEIDKEAKILSINFILNKGLAIYGSFKIITINEDMIIVKTARDRVEIEGENLTIKTMAKGELIVCGKIFCIRSGEKNE